MDYTQLPDEQLTALYADLMWSYTKFPDRETWETYIVPVRNEIKRRNLPLRELD